jgi:hypothetical protein
MQQSTGFLGEKSEQFFWGLRLPNGTRATKQYVLTDIPGIHCPDHVAFITTQRGAEIAQRFWGDRGFTERTDYCTEETPALHMVLTSPGKGNGDCGGAVVITVPTSTSDFLPNRLLSLYGQYCHSAQGIVPGIPQHYALEVTEETELATVASVITSRGFQQIADVLTVTNAAGATLEQTFFVPVANPSPLSLVELVRRCRGTDGDYMQFNVAQIEEIYRRFDAHAQSLGV